MFALAKDRVSFAGSYSSPFRLATPGAARIDVGSSSGANGTAMRIVQVSSTDFDDETATLHEWVSNSPAADSLLMPFWAAPSTPNVFLTAYKIF